MTESKRPSRHKISWPVDTKDILLQVLHDCSNLYGFEYQVEKSLRDGTWFADIEIENASIEDLMQITFAYGYELARYQLANHTMQFNWRPPDPDSP